MGFGANACGRALVAVKNAGVEQATNWLMEHLDDPDLNDPLPPPSEAGAAGAKGGKPRPDYGMITGVAGATGMTEEQAEAALLACDNQPDRAVEWLFEHVEDLHEAVKGVMAEFTQSEADAAAAPELNDGEGRYELVGFISHVGRNTGSGHYVCHIKKGGQWAIFDDQKVALSENPPRDLGYLYLFARQDNMVVS
jgi:ubiquitin carboxyl-terminal hydrolase 5/13